MNESLNVKSIGQTMGTLSKERLRRIKLETENAVNCKPPMNPNHKCDSCNF